MPQRTKIHWILRGILGGILTAGLCAAQELSFDAASVKLFDPGSRSQIGTTGGPGTSDPGRIHFGRAPMIQLLLRAYGVGVDEVVGPAWIRQSGVGGTAYVVTATMPSATTRDQFQSMLRNLLQERFHLQVHRETRKFPSYHLVVAKGGVLLKEAAPDPHTDTAAGSPPSSGGDALALLPSGHGCIVSTSSGVERIKCQKDSMIEFAATLGRAISRATGADPAVASPRVIDMTGLAGIRLRSRVLLRGLPRATGSGSRAG
jgi:uncharacterized protein (TIGR03435 family)